MKNKINIDLKIFRHMFYYEIHVIAYYPVFGNSDYLIVFKKNVLKLPKSITLNVQADNHFNTNTYEANIFLKKGKVYLNVADINMKRYTLHRNLAIGEPMSGKHRIFCL